MTNYTAAYDSEKLRGIDDPLTPRAWNMTDEILKLASSEKKLLDLGCGTAFKIFPLSKHFNHIIGLDPSSSMLKKASRDKDKMNLNNICFIRAYGESLPFPNNTFDIISCILSRWNIAEIHRVLKKNGSVIIEQIGCDDKRQFKEYFGKDELGWRGQFINYQIDDYLKETEQQFKKFFRHVNIISGYWNTDYCREGLEELLLQTPTIRGYNPITDKIAFEQALKNSQVGNKFTLQQHRILIYAKP